MDVVGTRLVRLVMAEILVGIGLVSVTSYIRLGVPGGGTGRTQVGV